MLPYFKGGHKLKILDAHFETSAIHPGHHKMIFKLVLDMCEEQTSNTKVFP